MKRAGIAIRRASILFSLYVSPNPSPQRLAGFVRGSLQAWVVSSSTSWSQNCYVYFNIIFFCLSVFVGHIANYWITSNSVTPIKSIFFYLTTAFKISAVTPDTPQTLECPLHWKWTFEEDEGSESKLVFPDMQHAAESNPWFFFHFNNRVFPR